LGVYGLGRTVSAEDMAFTKNVLNAMVKAWSTQGLHLWCKEEAVLYLTKYQSKYRLGSNGAYVTAASDEITTKLTATAATAANSITVGSTVGMIIGDNIGVVLNTLDLFWTTIDSVDSATQISLVDTLPSTASINNLVFSFTDRIYKPLRVISARCVNGLDEGETSTKTEIFMTPIAYKDYFELLNKTSNGTPTQYHYNPKLTDGNMYVWQRPSDASYRVEFTYERLLEDLNTASSSFDFPSEWVEPLTFQLAVRLGPAFGKDQKIAQSIGPMAQSMLESLKDWDSEITSIYISPDIQEN
jgi:hypothetical protein